MNDSNLRDMYYSINPISFPSLEKYIDFGTEIRLFAGEALLKQKAFILYIKMGMLKIWLKRDNGTPIDFCYCRQGTCLQLNDLVINTEEWNIPFVTAAQNTIVIAFTKDQFYGFLQKDRQIFDEYINSASSYSTMLRQRLMVTAGLNASLRVLTWLDRLCQCSTPDSNGTYTIECNLTQQQIADILFIHVSTCNKIFSKLLSEHVAQHARSKLIIYDNKKIKHLIEQNSLSI